MRQSQKKYRDYSDEGYTFIICSLDTDFIESLPTIIEQGNRLERTLEKKF